MKKLNQTGAATMVIIVMIVLLIVVGIGAFLVLRDDDGDDTSEANTSTVQTSDQEQTDEASDSSSTLETAELVAQPGYTGSGTATRDIVNGKFTHIVNADIQDPAEGKFFEGWLVKGSDFFSTGELKKNAGQYFLQFESDTDYSDYDLVVITEETSANGLDGVPEDHVIEGSF